MTSDRKRRARRRKLAAHDRGEDRHNRGLAWLKKQTRARDERERARAQPPRPPG